MLNEDNEEMEAKPPFFLKEIYCIPFSRHHHQEVFLFMLKNGLFQQVKVHCLRINQQTFEDHLREYPLLIDAHLDFYSKTNEYWLGTDRIDHDRIEIILTLRSDTVIWFFIQVIDTP
jgi:hypothetical protein